MCETRLWDYIDPSMEVYRGSLTMPKDASPDQHVKTRRNFRQILDRWKGDKYTVEMRGLLHITDPLNAHWDLLAYSDAPVRPLKTAVAEAWHRAGGKRRGAAFKPISEKELVPTIKYQNKDTINPEVARRYLPETQKNMGMNFVWHTRRTKTSKGFWQGHSRESLWREWVEEWYGKSKADGCRPIVDREVRLKLVSELRALTPLAEDYLRGFSWYTPPGSVASSEGDLDDLLETVV